MYVPVGGGNVASARIGNSSLVAVGATNGNVTLYRSLDRVGVLPGHPTGVVSLGFDPKAEALLAAGCSGGSLWLWDVVAEKQLSTFSGHRSSCTRTEFHPFGNFFASGGTDSNVRIWDARSSSGKSAQTFRGHESGIACMQFSPHGKWLVSGDSSGGMKVWDLTAGKCLYSVEEREGIVELDFHPNDFFLVTGAADQSVKLWSCDEGSGGLGLVVASEPGDGPLLGVKFFNQGAGLAVARETGVKKFAIDLAKRRIVLAGTVDVHWDKGLLDWGILQGGRVVALSAGPTGAVVRHDLDLHDEPIEQENIPLAPNAGPTDSSIPPNVPPAPSIKSVLEERLLVARSTAAMWLCGNIKSAVDEAIVASERDPGNFVSFCSAVERTRTPISLDTCCKILAHIVQREGQELTLPLSTDPTIAFSSFLSSSLRIVVMLAQKFAPILTEIRRTALTTPPPGSASDFAREERIGRGNTCLDLFDKISCIVQAELRSSRVLKKEKEDALAAISLIQSG